MQLKANEICRLIRVCSTHGVTELKMGDLNVTFAPKASGLANHSSQIELPLFTGDIETEHSILERDEIRLKEDQLDLALIENPAEYEKLVLAGELEDEDTRYQRAE